MEADRLEDLAVAAEDLAGAVECLEAVAPQAVGNSLQMKKQ